MNARRCTTLSVAIDPKKPPQEFRIFRAGENPNTKGVTIFDQKDAKAVMGEYKRQGVDVMIDLNHDAVTEETLRARSNAADAMGWCKLALRNGELWAVDVQWTQEGDERIRSRKQRYISPCFLHDKDGHVRELINLALVPMPATHGAIALASKLSPRERGERYRARAKAQEKARAKARAEQAFRRVQAPNKLEAVVLRMMRSAVTSGAIRSAIAGLAKRASVEDAKSRSLSRPVLTHKDIEAMSVRRVELARREDARAKLRARSAGAQRSKAVGLGRMWCGDSAAALRQARFKAAHEAERRSLLERRAGIPFRATYM